MYNELNITIDITPEKPFEKCKLGREKSAIVLTKLIDSYPKGMVLALNDKWGTGKTTFVRMWQVYLENLEDNKFETIYFNAWENDFDENPLVAILSEFKKKKIKGKDTFKTVLKTATVMTKHIAPIIAKGVMSRYTGIDDVSALARNVIDGSVEILEKEVNEYAKRKDNILDFRKKLEEYVDKITSDKPLVFIIDELDRCRPNYSVQLLEQIKHFFNVPNIIFVLSIDKEQLGNAIRGFYGSDRINSNDYLRRFIDLEYSLPKIDSQLYCDYLYDKLDFKSYFESEKKRESHDGKHFRDVSNVLFSNNYISLRVQEKVFIHTRIALRMFKYVQYVFPHLFLYLIYIKIIDNQFYSSILRKEFSVLDLQKEFHKRIKNLINRDNKRDLVIIEASLIKAYNSLLGDRYSILYIEKPNNESIGILVESKIDNDILKDLWQYFSRYDSDNILEYLLKKIEIADNFES